MQTLRFNPFGQVHKGLRALLYDSAMLLQHTDFTVPEKVTVAVERIALVNTLFEHHAYIEDSRIFPLVESFEPQLVAEFEAQHQKDHELSTALERCLHLFNETNSPEQNAWVGNELLQSFNAFLAFNVEHMKQEETIVNSCLWCYYTDAELLKKVQEISASIPPEQNKQFVYWMLKGMADHEIINWYSAVKLSAPAPVFSFFCDLATSALPAVKWEALKEKLQVSSQFA